MIYYTIKPTGRLTDFVRYFWVFEGNASEAQPYVHRTFANVCPELLFHYRGTFSERTIDNNLKSSFLTGIHGQTKQYRQFVAHQPFGIFGVYLYPYALPALFGISSIEFTNELPDLHSVMKNEDRCIEHKMLTASDNKQRLAIITAFLENRLKDSKGPEIVKSIRVILSANGRVNVGDLASQCCLSLRQFERNFKDLSGFTPKTFARIARFYSLVENNTREPQHLTDLAYSFGYYDQSHFIADFKEFSGLTPKTWFGSKLIDTCAG